jgi:hypothetical protein
VQPRARLGFASLSTIEFVVASEFAPCGSPSNLKVNPNRGNPSNFENRRNLSELGEAPMREGLVMVDASRGPDRLEARLVI